MPASIERFESLVGVAAGVANARIHPSWLGVEVVGPVSVGQGLGRTDIIKQHRLRLS
jgi:hypothetical protein